MATFSLLCKCEAVSLASRWTGKQRNEARTGDEYNLKCLAQHPASLNWASCPKVLQAFQKAHKLGTNYPTT